MDGFVYVIGTCDTKGDELRYAAEQVGIAGAKARLVDVSTRAHDVRADVPAAEVARCHPRGAEAVLGLQDRGQAVEAMSQALTNYLLGRQDIRAVLGLGGSGNTMLVTAAMRALPIGLPKLMVSTVTSGNIAPYVGSSDIAMMYSVVDIAGLNDLSRRVIGNAAHAVAGMALASYAPSGSGKPAIGMTMFGVTTACVTAIRSRLASSHETFVFHATGTGGQSMEKLAESGFLQGIIDATTTEVADFLVGGVLACTEDRFGSVIRRRIPWVGSVGALDMVNFGERHTVPPAFAGRRFHIHNPQITLMRTTPEENRRCGEWIVSRINRMEGPVRFLLPLRGVSAIDAPGQPFHDPAADQALFDAIRAGWRDAPNRKLIEIDAHINDDRFAEAMAGHFLEIQ
jgi:uncharacterized protein (UPF0261 family)